MRLKNLWRIELIIRNPKITRIKMAEALHVSKTIIERALKASNRIKHVGSYKGGHCEVTE